MAALQLKAEIQNELVEANRLLTQIRGELAEIKKMTSDGGCFDAQTVKSAGLVKTLENLQGINEKNIQTFMPRIQLDDTEQSRNHS